MENIRKNALLIEILDRIPSAVYVADTEGRLIYVNRAGELLDNYSREDVLGKKIEDIYHDTFFDKEKASPLLATLREGRIYQDENLEWYSNGKIVNALTNTWLVKDNDCIEGVYSICDDITNMKKRIIHNIQFDAKTIYSTNLSQLQNGTRYIFESILGKSEGMRNAVATAQRFASKHLPVMLYGETGTGKEMFAQSIHNASPRYKGPFVAVNCAAIPDTLLESTLFGTKKGAFTGAIDSEGLFEKAQDGTLFLDEINSLPLMLQAKLLRALQEKEIQRIGEGKTRKINCRIISATNKMPNALIKKGTMREDLYYRLSTGIVSIPPLRERGDDLDLLISNFILRLNKDLHMLIIGLTPTLSSLLHKYNWPGNIRELINVLESAFNLASEKDGYLGMEHLPSYIRERIEESILKQENVSTDTFSRNFMEKKSASTELVIEKNINYMVDQYERMIIEKALTESQGKLTHCSKKLGISHQALSVKLKKYDIDCKKYK